MKQTKTMTNQLTLVRLGIDTKYEHIIYLQADCFVCKSEGFEASTRILVTVNNQSIIATLDIIRSDLLKSHEASLSESAWKRLGVKEGDFITLSHVNPVASFKSVRSKIYGNELAQEEFDAIIGDVVEGKYSNIQLASFITACASDHLNIMEIVRLTKAMIKVGEQLRWEQACVTDKHSVGGIPGNKTTPIVVAIIAEAGLLIPKTSSRAITSPAGTADTVETMTKVDLNIEQMRNVVGKEGGCIVWGGAIGLSPADDIIIRVERSLDIDPPGQMVASVLSKKAAVGTTHVVIEIPVGPSAKVRSEQEFLKFKQYFETVANAIQLNVKVLKTDGSQPLGRGIGPALEAKDILQILNNDKNAPNDLKQKALMIAGEILEFANKTPVNQGILLAKQILESGNALKKFIAICEAQGGFREPSIANYTYDVVATHKGTVIKIDNRNLAMIAKLAGAPHDPEAGITFFARMGTTLEKGQLLYRIHAKSKGELEYSLNYARTMPNIIKLSHGE
jgi:thymidine phosphorylase